MTSSDLAETIIFSVLIIAVAAYEIVAVWKGRD